MGERRVRKGRERAVADVAAVHYEHDCVAHAVVGRPDVAERVLPTYVPDLEVHVWEVEGGDVLADGGDGGFRVDGRGGVGGEGSGEERFERIEEGGFAGVVEAEEEDGIFWEESVRGEEFGGRMGRRGGWRRRRDRRRVG